jgi:hypothetical protein
MTVGKKMKRERKIKWSFKFGCVFISWGPRYTDSGATHHCNRVCASIRFIPKLPFCLEQSYFFISYDITV